MLESAGIGALGLDWRAMLFQILNFSILLLLLRKFAYQPIVNVLEERRRTIAESLQNVQDIAAIKDKLAKEKEGMLGVARGEAQRLVEQAKERGNTLIAAAEAAASEQAQQLLTQAQAQITQDVSEARQGLRQEVIGLVAAATAKVIEVKLDAKNDAVLIERAVRETAAH
jgi:F-type H+-transporting ATPase subunit b